MSSLNWVDYVVLIVIFGSVLAGLLRGLLKELIGLITWVAAFVAAVMFSSPLAAVFTNSSQVQSAVSSATSSTGLGSTNTVSYAALGISFIVIFIGVLIIGKIINSIASSAVEGVGLGFANRLLGGVFGFARGVLMVFVLMFVIQLSPISTQPYWTQSYLVAYFQPIVQMIANAVSPGLEVLKSKIGNTIQNANPQQLIQGMADKYQTMVN